MTTHVANVSLVILTDLFETDLDYCTYLINLLKKKFSHLNFKLTQIYIFAKQTTSQYLIDQLKLIKAHSNDEDLLVLTPTTETNDSYCFNLIKQTFENNNDLKMTNNECQMDSNEFVPSKILLLKKHGFHSDLARICMRLAEENSFNIAFNNETELVATLNTLFELDISQNSIDHFSNADLQFNKVLNNYYANVIEIKFFNEKMRESFRKNKRLASKLNRLMVDNLVNADFYVYEFAKFSEDRMHTASEDLKFLHNKIEPKLFLAKLQQTIDTIEESMRRYAFDELCISFNGGKDCCVVLYLFYAVALRRGAKFPLNLLLMQIANQFDEMNDFVNSTVRSFYAHDSLEFIVFDESKTMKQALAELKTIKPKISAILLGTRKSDGDYFKQMPVFIMTDNDWPTYMRVNPILDWTYSEIWYFIRMLQLPYCVLYDQGYTSIDHKLNTVKNKHLIGQDRKELPAWMLEDQMSERHSRKKK